MPRRESDGAEALVLGVQRDPRAVIRRAAAVLVGDPTSRERVLAGWATGMARRELGELDLSRRELEQAWVGATELPDADLAGQIAITLSLVVAYQGDLAAALEILDISEPSVAGAPQGRLRSQRGIVLYQRGDFDAAMAEYAAAIELLGAAGDVLGEARVHVNVGALLSYLGRLREAREHLETAVAQGAQLEQTLLHAVAEQNLAHINAMEGDFPAAFDAFDRATQLYASCSYDGPLARSLRLDHARALLQANLLAEACETAEEAVLESKRAQGELELAESLLVAAEAHLAADDADRAVEEAELSRRQFDQHGRSAWATLARAVVLRARARGDATAELAREVAAVGEALRIAGHSGESLRATILAAELWARLGETAVADGQLRSVARALRHSLLQQPEALRVRALVEVGRGNRAAARRAVNLAVRLQDDHQAVLGAIDLRAHAAASSEGLALIGARLAIDDRRPRELLAHLEAMRRTTSMLSAARPPDDDRLAELLAQLRLVARQAREVVADGARRHDLERQRSLLERSIRAHVRRAPARGTRADVPLAGALRALGERALIAYANVGGTLVAVSVVGGRAALHELGDVDGVLPDVDGCTLALHRLNRVQGTPRSREVAAMTLDAIATELSARLLPPRVGASSRPVVIVPTGALHGLPWGILPDLRGRPVSITPSLTAWAIAALRTDPHAQALLVAGPDLAYADAEVDALAVVRPDANVLVGAAATAERCLTAIGGADLAHIACHGSYRSDNPLFSTLRLADGPLTVYDLERSRAMPRTVVLSACNVAMGGASRRGGPLLGLASSLMIFGAASVIAPLTPISDERVGPAMTRLHLALLAGHPPAAALSIAARTDDGRADTALSAFVALGA